MDEKSNKWPSPELNAAVIDYVKLWLESGCPGQDRQVFDHLAMPMPAPCTETVCIRRQPDGTIELLTTVRNEPGDKIYQGVHHSVGAAHMLRNYINKHEPAEFLALFPQTVAAVQKDETWWNLSTGETVMLRIFRRELGLADPDCLNLIRNAKFAGVKHDLTPRGGETVLIYLVDVTYMLEKITKPVVWVPVKDLQQWADEGRFIRHQVARVDIALRAMDK